MLAHLGPNLQLPWVFFVSLLRSGVAVDWGEGLTLAKYLQTVSEAAPSSWLKGQALPAWQAPWR